VPQGRAAGNLGLAEEEVENGADASRHDEQMNIQKRVLMAPARRVLADVTDHEEVKRGHDAPGDIEVDAEAERLRRVMALAWRDDPEIVFNEDKCQAGGDDRPRRESGRSSSSTLMDFWSGISGLYPEGFSKALRDK